MDELDGIHVWWKNAKRGGAAKWATSNHPVYHFELPLGLELLVSSGWQMEVLVKMGPQPVQGG